MRARKLRIRYIAAALILSGASVAWAEERTGQEVYDQYCQACHLTGVDGAPIKDDQEWVQRVTNKGMDALVTSVVEGFNAMPARGGCKDCTQTELINAIQYMLPKNMPM